MFFSKRLHESRADVGRCQERKSRNLLERDMGRGRIEAGAPRRAAANLWPKCTTRWTKERVFVRPSKTRSIISSFRANRGPQVGRMKKGHFVNGLSTCPRRSANSRLALYTMTSCLEGIAMTYLKWCFLFSLKLFCKEKNYMNSLIDLEAGGVNKYQK